MDETGDFALLILGIETSCDETAAAVVSDARRVLSNVVASQFDLHAEYGGVVPEIASRAHAERIRPIIDAALAQAGLTFADLDAVAVGHRPGLIGSLLVGVAAAKALAWSLAIPLVGVDHLHAHLYAAAMGDGSDDEATIAARYPALGLVVSGGHTALYHCASPTQTRRLGATIDDAVGEAFDKVAAILGLPHPGGPAIDALAAEDGADDRAFDLPISRLDRDSLDFSYSGLKTAVLYAVRGNPRPRDRGGGFDRDHRDLSHAQKRDVAASFQRAACRAIIIKLERALDELARSESDERKIAPHSDQRGVRSLLVGGGVSANARLRREITALGRARRIDVYMPPMSLCVDNAAMIAALAHHQLTTHGPADLTLTAVPTTGA
ncbi:MAG: tRNA (adenosine(37)-N6)-threonylcarbamoyltransferase complex transferase subunit TsaD [Leptolyngbya sp. PLA3]|nr:MAG: tRNA (adenosine(37)-N6)-threonylcarbamoyltransferase complex transferase subunit TsaD [Cyanobacteria bacterium CYA]MCE7969112.1 tRNA (adenosine(37)-N6)-threonylcarbamoyltransferase complex transferase subunit TsaD [Leptolyngbya sp. PL-A3]